MLAHRALGVLFAATAAPPHVRLCLAPADDIIVREATLAELDAITDLTIGTFFGDLGDELGFNNCRAMAFYELRGEQQANLRRRLGDAQSVNYMATEADGRRKRLGLGAKVVGFVTRDGDGTLTNLAVDPSRQRRGIGRMLVERVLAEPMPVVLEVDSDNDSAIKLYDACGFERTHEKEGTRYAVDWWRGRISQTVTKVGMAHTRGRPRDDGST